MNGYVSRTAVSLTAFLGLSVSGAATAADLAPHRALYTLSLERSESDSGVSAVSGTMAYELSATCNAWNVEQRYRLKMVYSESPDVTIASSLESSETRNGLRYRFDHKETRSDEEETTSGTAKLDRDGDGSVIDDVVDMAKGLFNKS